MKEIIAMEAFGTPYMTQAEELSTEERGYWTRVRGVEVNKDNYRGASREERDAWKAEIDAVNAEDMPMFNNINE